MHTLLLWKRRISASKLVKVGTENEASDKVSAAEFRVFLAWGKPVAICREIGGVTMDGQEWKVSKSTS
jgi:hypothetical protein